MFYRSFLETLVLNANYEKIVVGSSQISTFNFSALILHFLEFKGGPRPLYCKDQTVKLLTKFKDKKTPTESQKASTGKQPSRIPEQLLTSLHPPGFRNTRNTKPVSFTSQPFQINFICQQSISCIDLPASPRLI